MVMQVDKSSSTCRCFMLDYGNEVVMSWKNLVRLDEKFQVLPAQAVKASLAGVANMKDGRQVEFVRKYLEKRRLVGVVVDKSVRRVMVMQVDKSSSTCRCFMLDYGNEVVLS